MKQHSMELANLADHAYLNMKPGVRRYDEMESVRIVGHDYKIIEHVNSSTTGYQGTSYQRLDTGQVFVAHRGTEANGQDVGADLAMVALRVNRQAPEAIALTALAIHIARQAAALHGECLAVIRVPQAGGRVASFGARGPTKAAAEEAALSDCIGSGARACPIVLSECLK